MATKSVLNIKPISIPIMEKSLLYPSSLISQLREFCIEIAAATGHTEKESKARVVFTTTRINNCLITLFKDFKVESEYMKIYSRTILQLEQIINNEWGFVPNKMQKSIKIKIYNLNICFGTIKPIKNLLPLRIRIIYAFNSDIRNMTLLIPGMTYLMLRFVALSF